MGERVLGLGKNIRLKMNDNFFEDLNIPEPDVNLAVTEIHRRSRQL
jgi:hypothetical protein